MEPTTEVQANAFVARAQPTAASMTIFGQLTQDGKGVAGAQMHCIVHYRTTTSHWPKEGAAISDANGRASVGFGIGNAIPGCPVQVEVYFIQEGWTYHTTTSSTPQD